MGRGLPRRLTESNLPDLPEEFVRRVRRKGRRTMSLTELVEEFKEWQSAVVSGEDREFVRNELAWLAEWIHSKYPKLNFRDVRRFLREMVPVSV